MTKKVTSKYEYDSPDEAKDADNDVKRKLNKEAEDLKALMEMPAFRRYLWKLLERTHVFHTSFTGNSETFFREGERNIGLRVFNDVMAHCPDLYAVMVKESKGEQNDS